MKSITDEIEELRTMDVPGLVARYTELHGRPPRVKHKEWLWRRVAWKLQEQRFGGLSTLAQRKLDELIGEIDLPLGRGRTVTAPLSSATKPGMPKVGTTLTRIWRGKELRVTVMESGFAHEGVVYRTLSAAANAITGSHVSGKAFFGLTKQKEAK